MTFAKRERELNLKNRARDKEARRVARKAQPRDNKGPEIAWDEAVRPLEGGAPGTSAIAPTPPASADFAGSPGDDSNDPA
jgi:hypothetical protein